MRAAEPPIRPIGFRVLECVDASRASKTFPAGRPLQIALWYPAASASPSLSYSDYVALGGTETSFSRSGSDGGADAIVRFREFLKSARVSAEDADALLANPMQAERGAAPAAGRYPIVLIAQGNDESAADQAFLAELLAGHGYLVATTPSQSRIGGPMASELDIPTHASDQAADLGFALRQVRAEANARAGAYGLVGHSFGARSALLLAMRDSDAAALVSLDGGIGLKAGKGLLEKASGFDRGRAALPLLHFYEEADARASPDFELLRALDRSDRWLVRVEAMRHVHFTSLGLAVRELPSLAAATSATDRTGAAWNAVAEVTAAFFDRWVGRRSAGDGRGWTPPTSPLLRFDSIPGASLPKPTPASPRGRTK